MAVQIGNSRVAGLYHGDTPIQALYGGHEIVWPPQGSRPSAPTSTQQLDGPVMFDADYGRKGLGAYKNLHPIGQIEQGIDVGTCLDPIDQSRVVMFSDNRRGFHSGNGHPRAQIEGPFFMKPKKWDNNDARYALYHEILFPSDFPNSPADWTSIGGSVHGAPWTTGSAMGLLLTMDKTTGKHILRMHDTPEWLGSDVELPLGRWVGILRYCRYEHAVDGGFIELWMNTTGSHDTGWEQIPIMGQDRFTTDVISDDEGNGWWKDPTVAPASPRVGLYGSSQGISYTATHRIGRSPADVLPAGWDGLVSGQTFVEAPADEPATVTLTQAEYDALDPKDPGTTYIITEG